MGVGSAIGLMTAFAQVGTLAKGAMDAHKTIQDGLDKWGDLTTVGTQGSIFRKISDTIIISRVYVDGAISQDPVMDDILKTCQGLYASAILQALHMDQFVTGSTTIKDILKPIQTYEHLDQECVSFDDDFKNHVMSQRSRYRPFKRKDPPQKNDDDTPPPFEYIKPIKRTQQESVRPGSTLPMGQMIEVEFTNPNSGVVLKANLIVQLTPYIIHRDLTPEFITLRNTESLRRRIIRWRAGELSFFRDLLFSRDILRKDRRILQRDKDGILAEFMDLVSAKDRLRGQAVMKKIHENAEKGEKAGSAGGLDNIANTVMIFSEEAVQKAKASSGVDLHNRTDRDRYFDRVMAMMLIIVDPNYNTVTLYLNGIRNYGTFTYKQLESPGKGNPIKDLTKLLEALHTSNQSRF